MEARGRQRAVGWSRAIASLLFTLVVTTSFAHAAEAQVPARPDHDPTDAEVAEARALFMAGQAAVDAGRWADAVQSFSRAYELSGVAAALYNLGFAYRALGRHREARDAFDTLLEEFPRFDRDKRREARRYRDESAARVASIRLLGLDPGRRYVVRFDGAPVPDDGTRPLAIEADAGGHTLTVRAPGFSPFVWEGEVGDSEHASVDVELTTVTVGGGGDSGGGGGDAYMGSGDEYGGGTDRVDEGGGFPWEWVAVAIVGVLVAGGALAGYIIWQEVQLDGESMRVKEL